MSEETFKYVPFIKAAPPDVKYNKEFKPVLIYSEEQLLEIISGKTGVTVAADTETKTLDFSMKNPLVGISFSFTPYDGYYCPFRHNLGNNLPPRCLGHLNEFFGRNNLLMYNAIFDMMMLKAESFGVEAWKIFEVMTLVFNVDTNVKTNSLKWAASHFLGREVKTFEELMGKNMTIDQLSPEEVVFYAAADTANTFGLFRMLYDPMIKECREIIRIDNLLTKAMFHYMQTELFIDAELMKGLATEYKEKIRDMENKIFRMVGYPFVMDSNRQLSQALQSMGIDTGQTTKTGDMKLDEHTLKKINHPICKMVIERNSQVKQLGSYVEKFSKQGKTGRIQYFLFRVPTGRLASGNKDNPYFMSLNAQNLTKPDPQLYECVQDDGPGNILGYKFLEFTGEPSPNKLYVEGYSKKENVRRAITVPDKNEWYFMGLDYSQEELMIAGMLSREPVMMKAFETGEDLHTATALQMYPGEKLNKGHRKFAKFANFGFIYLGNAWTLQNSSGLPISQCEDIYNRYWQTMKVLMRWIKQQISMCYQRGGVTKTAFGRPRRLAYWLSSPEKKNRKFGERSVVSHIVQGTAGDVMRIALHLLRKNIYDVYTEDMRFAATVHDEVDSCIRKEAFTEIVPKMIPLMEMTVPGCKYPLKVEVSVGDSLGNIFPFVLNKESNKWEPKYEAA